MKADDKIRRAVLQFGATMRLAKKDWDASGGDMKSWQIYYDLKDKARCELLDAVPEASRIGRLNQIVIDNPPDRWPVIIYEKIQAIRNGYSCLDCSKKIVYPLIRCDDCAEAYRQLLKERQDVARILAGKKPKKQKRVVRRKKLTVMRRAK